MKDLRKALSVEAPDFNLDATLDCGQVFGFRQDADGAWHGDIYGVDVALKMRGTEIFVRSSHSIEEKAVRNFFDLDRDLTGVFRILSGDEKLKPALDAYRGLRLIRQDSWEALACFILSSNNNVKRIQLIWKNLSRLSGGAQRFPSAREVSRAHERILREIGLGYRAPFLQRTAFFVAANPETLEEIRSAGYEDAKERVMAFPGIGEKVADCVLLYGFQKYEAFPVDVWILRIMRKLYFRNREVSEENVRSFAREKWGPWAGYVQQYLFHGARKNLL